MMKNLRANRLFQLLVATSYNSAPANAFLKALIPPEPERQLAIRRTIASMAATHPTR